MSNLTIHRVSAKAGAWRHDVPEKHFRRVSHDGMDFAVTDRNYYLESRTGKVRWTDEGEYIKEVYLVRGDDAVHAFSLPARETIEGRLAIPMAEDRRPLGEHVRDMLAPGAAFDARVAATAPEREAEPAAPSM